MDSTSSSSNPKAVEDHNKQTTQEEETHSFAYKVKAITFLTLTGGFGALAGFGSALARTKKSGETKITIFNALKKIYI